MSDEEILRLAKRKYRELKKEKDFKQDETDKPVNVKKCFGNWGLSSCLIKDYDKCKNREWCHWEYSRAHGLLASGETLEKAKLEDKRNPPGSPERKREIEKANNDLKEMQIAEQEALEKFYRISEKDIELAERGPKYSNKEPTEDDIEKLENFAYKKMGDECNDNPDDLQSLGIKGQTKYYDASKTKKKHF